MAMGSVSFLEFLLLFLFSGSPSDLVSFCEPQMALEILGEKTDEENLSRLIGGSIEGAVGEAGESSLDEKAARRAIENLASSSASIREEARRRLAGMGPSIRPRLEAVVASDPRRAAEAGKVLQVLAAGQKTAAHRRAVARLLAVRLAGDRKFSKLTPAIRKLADSPDPFLSQAARDVVSRLAPGDAASTGSAAKTAPPLKMLEALPPATRLLVTLRYSFGQGEKPSGPMYLSTFFKEFLSKMDLGDSGPSGDEVDGIVRQASQQLLDLAVNYGNFRLDGIAVANVGGIESTGAGLGILATGLYEREILEKGLEANGAFWTVQETAGKKVFTSMFARLVPLDDHRILILPQQASMNFPLEDYLKAVASGKRPLRSHARWDRFLDTLGGKAVLRGLALTDETLLSEMYTEMQNESVSQDIIDAVKGMSEVEIDVKMVEGARLTYRLEAAFGKAKQAEDLGAFVKESIQSGIQEMERMLGDLGDMGLGQQFQSYMKAVVEFLKGIHVVPEGKKGILRGELNLPDFAPGLMLPMMMMGTRAAPPPSVR